MPAGMHRQDGRRPGEVRGRVRAVPHREGCPPSDGDVVAGTEEVVTAGWCATGSILVVPSSLTPMSRKSLRDSGEGADDVVAGGVGAEHRSTSKENMMCDDSDDLAAARGLVVAVVLGLVLWVALILSVVKR